MWRTTRDGSMGARTQRTNALMALLVAPVVLFILIVFVGPVLRFLWLSVDNSDVAGNLGRTFAALEGWQPSNGLPDEAVFQALIADLAEARKNGRDGVLAQLINQRNVGARFLVIKTAKDAADGKFATPPLREAVLAQHAGSGDVGLWTEIHRARGSLTDYYLLGSIDLRRGAAGEITPGPADRAVFLDALVRPIWISFVVTLLCALLDRKSTRLNSSHSQISYAVFCLNNKTATYTTYRMTAF